MGGRGSAGLTTGINQKLTIRTKMFNGRGATKEEKAQKRNAVSRFMREAREGGRTVALSRRNVEVAIGNGAQLVKRRSRKRRK